MILKDVEVLYPFVANLYPFLCIQSNDHSGISQELTSILFVSWTHVIKYEKKESVAMRQLLSSKSRRLGGWPEVDQQYLCHLNRV